MKRALAALAAANTTAQLFTNGPVGINPNLNILAGINFAGAAGTRRGDGIGNRC